MWFIAPGSVDELHVCPEGNKKGALHREKSTRLKSQGEVTKPGCIGRQPWVLLRGWPALLGLPSSRTLHLTQQVWRRQNPDVPLEGREKFTSSFNCDGCGFLPDENACLCADKSAARLSASKIARICPFVCLGRSLVNEGKGLEFLHKEITVQPHPSKEEIQKWGVSQMFPNAEF